jgi:hypothetical protein
MAEDEGKKEKEKTTKDDDSFMDGIKILQRSGGLGGISLFGQKSLIRHE